MPGAAGQGRPARYDRRAPARPSVSVIVPTFNERDNIPVLVERLSITLADFDYEIVVVDDDSPDRTWEVVEELATDHPRLRLLRRVGRRGLSSAVTDGMAAATGSVLAVLDGDLQHDEAVLPQLVSTILDDGYDLCVGSREAPGGGYGSFSRGRRLVSWIGATLARLLVGTTVSDPMSGYFAVSRARFEAVRSTVNPLGFKIMLELLARGERPRVAEVGYQFRVRTRGETKLTTSVVWAYLQALTSLALARVKTSPRVFALYAVLALAVLGLRIGIAALIDPDGQQGLTPSVPIVAATIGLEWSLHHHYTFHHRHSHAGPPPGRRRWGTMGAAVRSLVLFPLVALHGHLALTGLAPLVEAQIGGPHPLTRSILGLGLAGAAVAAVTVVAYGLSTSLVWPQRPDPVAANPVTGADR